MVSKRDAIYLGSEPFTHGNEPHPAHNFVPIWEMEWHYSEAEEKYLWCKECGLRGELVPEHLKMVSSGNSTYYLDGKFVRSHILPVLHYMARKRCVKSNCGTVCLCEPCHARKALEKIDPKWTP